MKTEAFKNGYKVKPLNASFLVLAGENGDSLNFENGS